jgi:rubredoxin
MSTTPLVRVLLRGGVVSPADLLQVVEMARRVGSAYLLPGVRQDLLFPVAGTSPDAVVELFGRIGLSSAVVDTASPLFRGGANNVASSYLAVNVVETTWWLKESVYQRIFENFGTDPRIRVNFVDPLQGIVPLFHGDLNFIASTEEHYWHLHLRIPGADRETLQTPGLVHSGDIAKAVRAIEERWHTSEESETDLKGWEMFLREVVGTAQRPVGEEVRSFPTPAVPSLEGFHAQASGQYWLGLYRRDGRFPIDFLKALCSLCQETLVGKIAITPWKSLLIKGIRGRARPRWEALMGEYAINVWHSSLELNWHIPALDTEALDAKRRVVGELDRGDASVHGLTFTLSSSPRGPYFTSVVIERISDAGEEPVLYDVRAAARFNPNLMSYHTFAPRVEEKELADVLIALSRKFARGEDPADFAISPSQAGRSTAALVPPVVPPSPERWMGYQCGSCLTVYEERYGAPEEGIDPGTAFADLSPEWGCSLCGAGRETFALVDTI